MRYIEPMNRFAAPVLIAALVLTMPALRAEEGPTGDTSQGFSLLEEGARMVLRGMFEDLRPGLEELQSGLDAALMEMEPALRSLALMIDDIRNYDPPVMLPNGDIVIRRKRLPPVAPEPGAEIEL